MIAWKLTLKHGQLGFKGNSYLLNLKMSFVTNYQAVIYDLSSLCAVEDWPSGITLEAWKASGRLEFSLTIQCCHGPGALVCLTLFHQTLCQESWQFPPGCGVSSLACFHHPCHSQQGNVKEMGDRSSRSPYSKHGPHPTHINSLSYLAQVWWLTPWWWRLSNVSHIGLFTCRLNYSSRIHVAAIYGQQSLWHVGPAAWNNTGAH